MRASSLLLLSSSALLLTLLTLSFPSSTSAVRRRVPGKARLAPSNGLPPPPPRKKQRSRLAGLFRRGKKKKLRGGQGGGAEESKNVYYYSVPGTTRRPRIILGDELDFSNLGITTPTQKSSLSALQTALIEKHLNSHDPLPPTPLHSSQKPLPRRTPKRTRGPGYRLRENTPWQDHYILEHSHKKPSHPKVMDSMMRAAGELRNAYKAAVIQSAKVAQFTGHAAAKYFKGVRNIFGGDVGRNPYRKQGNKQAPLGRDELELESQQQQVSPTEIEQEPEQLTESESITPPVYLDWGGSFWKFFYNKSKGVRRNGSLSQIEESVAKGL